jgi:phage tail-like protein
MDPEPKYQYLDLQDERLVLLLDGVTVDGKGRLRLAPVPGDPEQIGPPLAPAEALAGPAGIGVDEDGSVYVADPAGHRVLRIDPCDGQAVPLPCLVGPGSRLGELHTPRGLVVGPRDALYVADSRNHRIQVVDLRTLQLRGIWGQVDPYDVPKPGTAPGLLDDPWDLAADGAGCLYVADHGNRRVQKFDVDGAVVPGFWAAMSKTQSNAPRQPTHIALAVLRGEERLLVLDRIQGAVKSRLLAFRLDGDFDPILTSRWKTELTKRLPSLFRQPPSGVAFGGEVLYVADATGRRVLVFDAEGGFLGDARGFRGQVASLALDRRGRLLVHPGAGSAVVRLASEAEAATGTFRIGPVSTGGSSSRATRWHRLAARADPLPLGSHVRLFTYTTASAEGRPPPVPAGPSDGFADRTPTAQRAWRAGADDAVDVLVLNEPAPYLWIGGRLQAGGGSPVLGPFRVEHDHEGWLQYLPAVYQREQASRVLLERVLALFESILGDEETLVNDLRILFDPATADDGQASERASGSWLEWLAGWLAFELDETWDEETRREAVARAFELHARRGTAEGLRELLRLYVRAPVFVGDGVFSANLWALDGDGSVLGFTTSLVPAEAQGAVLGTTATLDRSHLIDEEDNGAPLFEDTAHRLCVQAYAADFIDPRARETLARIIEREKPAHTAYHLCIVEPRLRVGFQARVGVDAIVGSGPDEFHLDSEGRLGETVLAAETEYPGGVLGRTARVGRGTTLT